MKHRTTPLLALALTIFLGGLPSVEAQPIPSAAVACYFVARAYLDPVNGQGEVVGYFTDIDGIGASDTLFNGAPGEPTAFFTFRSDVFSLTPLPSNGDITLLLVSAGNFNIYYNANPKGDWSNPDTFSSGQLIAHFTRPEVLDLQFESFSFSQHAITETLVFSRNFSFNGHRVNFGDLTPGGITLYESISNTPLPAVAGFSLVLPFAGHGVAVVSESQNEQ